MNEYQIIHDMKIQGKSLVVLDRKREISDLNKTKAIIDGKPFTYSLTHGDNSLVIDTTEQLNGKTVIFE